MVERPSGTLDTLSLAETLQQAHQIHTLYEPSPLIVTAVHRLLVAILQDIYQPQETPDLVAIWRTGHFEPARITAFGEAYEDRFDLFSEEAPFLQTADLNRQPAKGDKAKPVGYLLQEQTVGTAVTHYNHAYDDSQIFCSHCAAKGLLVIPPFASSGGAGIKPSINGVPPIYVLPGGDTLFQSLVASLTTSQSNFQPGSHKDDLVWWQRPLPVVITEKEEVRRVGYLHSLTFPARRVRLHPTPMSTACTRCGQQTTWGVQTMVYAMGQSRPKKAPFWRDPFAAYRIPKKADDAPLPVRPVEGRSLWREFATLFLPDKANESGLKALQPAILEQFNEVWQQDRNVLPYTGIPLRTIGLRTDMKMKIFEWEEAGFAIPPRLLTDTDAAYYIRQGIDFAQRAGSTLTSTFSQYFGTGGDRYAAVKNQMVQNYWQQLGQRFHRHIQRHTPEADAYILFHQWLDDVLLVAKGAFEKAALSLPATGDAPVPSRVKRYSGLKRTSIKMIRLREDAMVDCARFLYGYRKKNYPKPKEVVT